MEITDELFDEWVKLVGLLGSQHLFPTLSPAQQAEKTKRLAEIRALVEREMPHSVWRVRYDLAVERLSKPGSVATGSTPAHEESKPEKQQSPPDDPIPDFTARLAAELRKYGSRVSTIYEVINAVTDWGSDQRDWKKAYVMACLSELVYLWMPNWEVRNRESYKVIPSSALQFLLEHEIAVDIPRLLQGADIRATVVDRGGYVFGTFSFWNFTVIAVRGSTSALRDWLIDFDERRINVGSDGYHAGFYLEACSAAKDVLAAAPPDRPIYLTGHSLGAALACILSRLWRGQHQIMTPYTFGGPRFGNDAVADTTPVYAYARAADPAPHVPPYAAGFRNAGWPVTVVPTGDEWMGGWELAFNFYKAVKAHSMERYREHLGNECKARHYDVDHYLKSLKEALLP